MNSGIPNLIAVDAEKFIYRGGQPVTDIDWARLRGMGIDQVIKLNTEAEGSDSRALAFDMRLMLCPITLTQQLLTEPDLESVTSAVAFIEPRTLIHCGSVSRTQHAVLINDDRDAGGNDRTGLICALYRIATGWTKQAAYNEMLALGFHRILFGLDKAFRDLTPKQ